jgi:hypothetical protein
MNLCKKPVVCVAGIVAIVAAIFWTLPLSCDKVEVPAAVEPAPAEPVDESDEATIDAEEAEAEAKAPSAEE